MVDIHFLVEVGSVGVCTVERLLPSSCTELLLLPVWWGIEPGALRTSGKCSSTKLHPAPFCAFSKKTIMYCSPFRAGQVSSQQACLLSQFMDSLNNLYIKYVLVVPCFIFWIIIQYHFVLWLKLFQLCPLGLFLLALCCLEMSPPLRMFLNVSLLSGTNYKMLQALLCFMPQF